MTRDEMVDAVRQACKAKGCLCRVDITIHHPTEDGLVVRAEAAHAGWCPLALARNRRNN